MGAFKQVECQAMYFINHDLYLVEAKWYKSDFNGLQWECPVLLLKVFVLCLWGDCQPYARVHALCVCVCACVCMCVCVCVCVIQSIITFNIIS